jgi:hypothetical protein
MSPIDKTSASRPGPVKTSRRRTLALLAVGGLMSACGGDGQESGWGSDKGKTGSFKMHKTIGDGPGM